MTAPLGPVNVLIMQRALRYGFVSGLGAGVGAALADVVFASAAAFSVSTVSGFIEGHSRIIQLVGGLIVGFIGARILWRQPGFDKPLPEETRRRSAAEMSVGTFFLTISNPATIFGFVAYFSALGEWAPDKGDYVGTGQMVLGVAIGTLGWWCVLSGAVTKMRVRLNETMIAKFNVIAGALLLGFGALILGRLSVTYFEVI
ncbi:LysE family transporter [Acuticoccus sp. MNP-M23]|uniref:LysE family translocator n=1 Tax=Acuticoccus sp. MNP-M23 TaxID=3072793 RepID=UPI0028164605|nr:LysE family transporter [Acuticoccus sp. MNP-M23]WMS42522.1 LysE family transporter [Acuticoccus sp. MNP-M23]